MRFWPRGLLAQFIGEGDLSPCHPSDLPQSLVHRRIKFLPRFWPLGDSTTSELNRRKVAE